MDILIGIKGSPGVYPQKFCFYFNTVVCTLVMPAVCAGATTSLAS
jgi:hypothetical protein